MERLTGILNICCFTDEQKRIVAKVDELMGLCDELEKGLTRSRENLGKVLKSVVHTII